MAELNQFERAVARMKDVLQVTKDGDVAAALRLSKSAFSERKRRDSFPEKELRELAIQRPDLNIDIDFVLTGSPRRPGHREPQGAAIDMAQRFGRRLVELRGGDAAQEFAQRIGVTASTLAELEAGRQMPTAALFTRLTQLWPNNSPLWLAGGDAPTLDRPLDDLETVLIQNYRAASAADQDALRRAAAKAAMDATGG